MKSGRRAMKMSQPAPTSGKARARRMPETTASAIRRGMCRVARLLGRGDRTSALSELLPPAACAGSAQQPNDAAAERLLLIEECVERLPCIVGCYRLT